MGNDDSFAGVRQIADPVEPLNHLLFRDRFHATNLCPNYTFGNGEVTGEVVQFVSFLILALDAIFITREYETRNIGR